MKSMRKRFGLISGICVLTVFATQSLADTSTAPAQQPATPVLERADLEAWLDGIVPYALAQGDIAGLVLSVVKDGQVLLEKGYGYADVAAGVPMDPQRTLVRVASVSKTFAATAVMQLVEQGKLDLDRDVNEYLDFEIPAAFGKPITLRNLLTHTAGFEETSYIRYHPPRSLRDHVLRVPERIYPPGEIPAYSSYGFNLAGYIVARVAGEPFAEYAQRHLLDPLGMEHSTFLLTPPEGLRALESQKYLRASSREPFSWEVVRQMAPEGCAAGCLGTTAHDMTRFMLAHLSHADSPLLRAQTLQQMHASSFVPMAGAQPVALGLFRTDYNGYRVIGHSGDGEAAHAEMKLLPDQDVGIFFAMNADGATQGFLPAAFGMRTMIFEHFMDRYFPAQTATDEATIATEQKHARMAAGEYVWSRQQTGDYQEALFLIARFLALKSTIRARDDGMIETSPSLTLPEHGRAQVWREVRPFVWREVGGRAHLFMKIEDGQVQAVSTDTQPSFWINMRVSAARSASLNVPLLLAATGALLLIVVCWPVGATVRRRYGATLQLTEPERRTRLWAHLAALTGVVYMLGWLIAMAADLASTEGSEPWIRLLQLIGLACIVGAGIALCNAWRTWQRARANWAARVSSVVLALALLYLVWFSFAFHLISARID
jgi:CubicO group peptidase (beta-lactamase class C family)